MQSLLICAARQYFLLHSTACTLKVLMEEILHISKSHRANSMFSSSLLATLVQPLLKTSTLDSNLPLDGFEQIGKLVYLQQKINKNQGMEELHFVFTQPDSVSCTVLFILLQPISIAIKDYTMFQIIPNNVNHPKMQLPTKQQWDHCDANASQ